jgi:tetratricopeptide (TPR) repeat protein
MALLELLVQSGGGVVTHEAIYKALWPRQSIGYHSIARCVYSLRKALSPEGRQYIKTVPKRGYHLTVPVDGAVQQNYRSALESSIQTKPLPYAHFLKGQACVNHPGPDSLVRALHWFREAIQIDPDFAAAHSAVAEVSMYQCYRGFIHPQEGLRVGLDACNEALRTDPNIVQALSLRGWFEALQRGEMERGLRSVEHARRLDPEYSRAYAYQALIHRAQGKMEAAMEYSARAVELDPHSLFNIYVHVFTLFLAGHVAEALQIAPDHPEAKFVAATCKATLEAMATYQDESGYFCHVLDNPHSNLEASGSLMFAYAVAKAIDLGIVPDTLLPRALKALNVVAGAVEPGGKVPGVAVPPGGPGVPFDWTLFGQGFFLLATRALQKHLEA